MRMPGSGQPFRREKILAADARKDLEHELTSYFEDASEQSKPTQYLDSNQQQELHTLEQEDRGDITSFLSLAHAEGISLPAGMDVESMSREMAAEQLTRSGPNAFPIINTYLDQHHLKTPEMMAFYTRWLSENPYSAELVLLQLLRDKRLYEDAYEALEVIGNVCRALADALTLEHRFYEEHLESIAHELIEIKSSVPTHHEEIERLIALTGTETARAYFAHTQNTLLDSSLAQELLGERDRLDEPADIEDHYDRDRDREDWYNDLRDHDRDEYSEDYGEYVGGTGLGVHVDPYAEVRKILDERGQPVTSDTPLITGLISFMPGRRTEYSPERRTEFLLAGYIDFKNLFERMDAGELSHIDVFEGVTNREMAKASLILGFRIMPREKDTDSYHVIGLQEDIRRRIAELEARKFKDATPLLEKMKERVEKQQHKAAQ